MMFYKNALEKVGVEMQIVRHGKFKAAVEPFMLDKMSAENLKLSMQKKEMSMNFNKEVQANKVQQTMALKIQNERHLNAETKIQVTFYDSLSGLDAQTLELVNEKIEEVRQQAQQKLAYMVQDIERKND